MIMMMMVIPFVLNEILAVLAGFVAVILAVFAGLVPVLLPVFAGLITVASIPISVPVAGLLSGFLPRHLTACNIRSLVIATTV
jgi:hypothetical protein